MLLLELLQIALGKRDRLSHVPSKEEWRDLFADAQKQSVVGIAFAGVQRLPEEQWPPRALLFEWIGAAESIKQRNATLDRQCVKLQKRFGEAGIRSSILKGQGVARYYNDRPSSSIINENPEHNSSRILETSRTSDQGRAGEFENSTSNMHELSSLRQPGDIDIFVDCGRERALQFAHDCGMRDVRWDYKHLHLHVFKDTEVEVHYRVEVLLNLWKNRKLQKWLKDHEDMLFSQNGDLVTPTVEFNRFYILLHIYRHFLYEGVGLRQLMDYFFVLKTACGRPSSSISNEKLKQNQSRIIEFENSSMDYAELTDWLKQFGMWKFARGVMWVLQEAFGLEKEYMLGEPLESEGRFILSEVMAGGNFGHHDKRLSSDKRGKLQTVKKVVKHNAHLMRHYPAEIIWPPLWFVWHKWWKWSR